MDINLSKNHSANFENKLTKIDPKVDKIQTDLEFSETEKKLEEVKSKISYSKKDVDEIIDDLNKMPGISEHLKFGYSDKIDELLVKVEDKKSNEIIRQFPSEDFISRIVYFRDNILEGLLFDRKA